MCNHSSLSPLKVCATAGDLAMPSIQSCRVLRRALDLFITIHIISAIKDDIVLSLSLRSRVPVSG